MTMLTIPATLEIPTPDLVEVLAGLVATEEFLYRLHGETSLSGKLSELATGLAEAISGRPSSPGGLQFAHAVVVEAWARGKEQLADRLETVAAGAGDAARAEAEEIRRVGYAYPDDHAAVALLGQDA